MLAFVYVPLNLATSIFGMNIQQLNRNGQPVWVFILTTVLAVFLTFFVWFLVEQRVGYVRWRRHMITNATCNDSWFEKTIDYNLVTRVAILILLLRKGYYRWAWYSRTWLRILRNDAIGTWLYDQDTSRFLQSRHISTCDFVCMNISHGHRFKSFYHNDGGILLVNR